MTTHLEISILIEALNEYDNTNVMVTLSSNSFDELEIEEVYPAISDDDETGALIYSEDDALAIMSEYEIEQATEAAIQALEQRKQDYADYLIDRDRERVKEDAIRDGAM